MNIGPVEIIVPAVVFLILYGLMWQEVASVRRAVEEQNRILTAIGRNAGWLPPKR